MKYNKAGINAVENVEATIKALCLPLETERKFNGIINAIKMQIEDYEYTEEVVKALGQALLLFAGKYASRTEYDGLERVISEFEQRLIKNR